MHKGRNQERETKKIEWKYLLFEVTFLDHQQRREFLMQFQDQEPEAFPIIDTSHILHNPLMHCIPQRIIPLPVRYIEVVCKLNQSQNNKWRTDKRRISLVVFLQWKVMSRSVLEKSR